jgi:polyhydroxyalkanoate synthesis regulator phasin
MRKRVKVEATMEDHGSATDVFEKMFLLGVGFFSMTKDKVESTVNELVERGRLSQEEGKTLISDISSRGSEQRDTFVGFVHDEIAKAMDRANIARKSDIDRLEAEIAALRAELRGESAPAASGEAAPDEADTIL